MHDIYFVLMLSFVACQNTANVSSFINGFGDDHPIMSKLLGIKEDVKWNRMRLEQDEMNWSLLSIQKSDFNYFPVPLQAKTLDAIDRNWYSTSPKESKTLYCDTTSSQLTSALLYTTTCSLYSSLPTVLNDFKVGNKTNITCSSTSPPPAQDPLVIQDNSAQAYLAIKSLLEKGKPDEIFDHAKWPIVEAFAAFSDGSKESSNENKVDKKEIEIEYRPQEKEEKPFLVTGKATHRTRQNCYVVRTKDGQSEENLKRLKNILSAIGTVRHTYEARGISGFSVCFPEKQLPVSLLKAMVGVEWIERDQYASSTQIQEEAPWQLSCIDNLQDWPSNKRYHFNSTGAGVNVYVIDSGVMVNHAEFEGRASVGYTLFPEGFPDDCAGHGTSVASIIAGTNVGVAKKANIILAQVLDCTGNGDSSGILGALNWIMLNHKKPAIINMSIGGPHSPAIDDGVRAAIAMGIPVIVAAGNSIADACADSPSGVQEAMVVGASTSALTRATFSNYGKCLDLFAPGHNVVGACIPRLAVKNGFAFISGTSFASPLIAGIYALLMEAYPDMDVATLNQKVRDAAASGVLDEKTLMGTENLLAQMPSIIGGSNEGTITFLPKGTLPALEFAVETVEVILIWSALGVMASGLLLVITVLLRNHFRKKRSKRLQQEDNITSTVS